MLKECIWVLDAMKFSDVFPAHGKKESDNGFLKKEVTR